MLEYFREMESEMVARFGISRAEAVARMNERYQSLEIEPYPDLMCHESPEFWAYGVYYFPDEKDRLPSGDAEADAAFDLTRLRIRPLPPRDSPVWTLRGEPDDRGGLRVLDQLRDVADSGDWRTFERLASVAVRQHPEGLAPILTSVLAAGIRSVNKEDLVDILGELRAPEAMEPISTLVREQKDSDGPFFPLCVKGIQSLAEIGTPDAVQFLRGIATSEPGEWPAPLRWHAAEELGIEDELGFDEDEMLGGV
jgi:hypothetical protein